MIWMLVHIVSWIGEAFFLLISQIRFMLMTPFPGQFWMPTRGRQRCKLPFLAKEKSMILSLSNGWFQRSIMRDLDRKLTKDFCIVKWQGLHFPRRGWSSWMVKRSRSKRSMTRTLRLGNEAKGWSLATTDYWGTIRIPLVNVGLISPLP